MPLIVSATGRDGTLATDYVLELSTESLRHWTGVKFGWEKSPALLWEKQGGYVEQGGLRGLPST